MKRFFFCTLWATALLFSACKKNAGTDNSNSGGVPTPVGTPKGSANVQKIIGTEGGTLQTVSVENNIDKNVS